MSNTDHRCPRNGMSCGTDSKLWCRDCPQLKDATTPVAIVGTAPPVVSDYPPVPSGAHGAPLAYQVGVNQLFDVLIDWQHPVRHVALTPAQAVALAGSLKRVANLAITQKKKAQRAELLGGQLRAKLQERLKGGAATDE
jgi:hypothetical protein